MVKKLPNGYFQFFNTSWENFRKGKRSPTNHWSIKKIKEVLPILPNTKGYKLLSKTYKNRKPLLWRTIDQDGNFRYHRVPWNSIYNCGLRFHGYYRMSITKIKHLLPSLPNTREYKLLSTKYNNNQTPLKWKFTDKYGNSHICHITWNKFYNFGKRYWFRISYYPYFYDKVKLLPNTKRYTPLDTPKTDRGHVHWRYIDTKNKIHYFTMRWCDFKTKSRRFKNVKTRHKDLVQEVYNSVGNEYSILYFEINMKQHGNYRVLVRHNSKQCNYFIYWTNLYRFLKLKGTCPKCVRHLRISKNERYFNELLKTYTSLKINKTYYHSYKIINKYHRQHAFKYSFDFYFPNYNLVVELDGSQHVKPVNWSGNLTKNKLKEQLILQKHRDKSKNNYCNKNSIKLLRIPCFYHTKNDITLSDNFKHVKKQIRKYFFTMFLPLINKSYTNKHYDQLSLF